MTPYRAPGERELPASLAHELVYLGAAETRAREARNALVLWLLVAMMGGLLLSSLGVWPGVVFTVLALVRWQIAKRPETIVLRVNTPEQLEVVLTDRIVRCSLETLFDVELENKTISDTYPQTIVGAVVVATGVQPEREGARIVMVFDDGTRVRLGGDFEPYSSVAQSLGRIRVFLRSHGWRPDDERL